MKAGLVKFPRRGTFVATDAGRALLQKTPDHIDVELLRQYPSFEEFYKGSHVAGTEPTGESAPVPSGSSVGMATTPEEQIEKALITVQSALRAELLQRVMQTHPIFLRA